MVKRSPRSYHSARREEQARETRARILTAARQLILKNGLENATIHAIARDAGVAAQTVYASFGSKRAIVEALMDQVIFSPAYESLVRQSIASSDPETRVRYAAKIARQIHDSLRAETEVVRGASAIAPDFMRGREQVRFERQAGLIAFVAKSGALRQDVGESAARDILWTFTGRDVYRMLVVERGWPSDRYEKWLGDTLVSALLEPKRLTPR